MVRKIVCFGSLFRSWYWFSSCSWFSMPSAIFIVISLLFMFVKRLLLLKIFTNYWKSLEKWYFFTLALSVIRLSYIHTWYGTKREKLRKTITFLSSICIGLFVSITTLIRIAKLKMESVYYLKYISLTRVFIRTYLFDVNTRFFRPRILTRVREFYRSIVFDSMVFPISLGRSLYR